MLKVNEIDVCYEKVQVLWGVSLRAGEREIVSIVGSNGAGKSTLLKTISGLTKPASGSIEFLDKRIEALAVDEIVEMGISHVPEGRRIFTTMTVQENLELGSYVKKAKAERRESLEQVYEIFPILKERKNQLAGTLSGGEQQMLAIGRCLMSKPKLCLLDEPSLGLAPKLVSKIFEIIREINKLGITVILVEQNVHRSLEIADRAYVLENGKAVLEGTGEELLRNKKVKEAYLGM